MFVAKYSITNKILKDIGIIDAAKEIIMTSLLVPGWEAKFKKEAVISTVYHSTHLEGNTLSEEDVQDILDGKEISARQKEIQEVVNLWNVMKFIDQITDQIGPGRLYMFTLETILEIHRLTTVHIVSSEQAGTFRGRQVVIKNSRTGEISYTPPPAPEVPFLVEDLVNWVNTDETREMHPVIKAAIIHYELSRIHPFVEGNGRVARAVAMLVMYLDGYDLHRFFSLDEYFDDDPMQYYITLQSVSNQFVMDVHERDLTPWIEYFVTGMAMELTKVKGKVKRISTDSRVKDTLGDQVQLNERQMIIMDYLHRHESMQNKDFRKIFPDYSDDTVLRELKFLKQKGLIKKVGGTKKASYVLKK